MFMGLRNWFQGMNSASLCRQAGRYENPIPPQCLAPIDCLKIPALDSVYGSHLTCRNLDTFHSACNKFKYFKGNKHNKIKRFLSHKMSKGAGNTSPLSAFRWISFYYVFFKSKEKYEAKTSVMADLFTLTYTPLPTPSRQHTVQRPNS